MYNQKTVKIFDLLMNWSVYMKYPIDVHTHTIVSGHAYSTLLENVKYASEIGLKILGTTDHGSNLVGSPHISYFNNFKVLPRKIYGVTVLCGCEANIIDYKGQIDIPEKIQKKMDIIIASAHGPTLKCGTREENTQAYLNVMDNPNIDILGHIGNPLFPINPEEIVKKAKDNNILIEINNSSFLYSRSSGEQTCIDVIELCKFYEVKIIMNSDAHICFAIGNFDESIKRIQRADMPEELIINGNPRGFIEFLQSKGKVQDVNPKEY